MSLSALASLLQRTDLDDHEEYLRAANAALKQDKRDIQALHVKAVALLKLDKYDDALHIFKEGGSTLQSAAPLEYSYTLYKTGHTAQAREVAEAHIGDDKTGLKHVLGQVVYRAEDFESAKRIYEELRSKGEDAEHDLRIQSGAVDAQLEWQGKQELVGRRKVERADLEAFETAYNAACGSIAREELGQADMLLKRARDLCNALDELSDEEKKAELIPITVQHVYVLSLLGKKEEAEKLASSLDVSSISELSTKHIAQINSLATSDVQANPYLAHRQFQSTESLPVTDPLFGFQSSLSQHNTYVMNLLTLKYDGVAKSSASYISQNEDTTRSNHSISVVNAAAHARNGTGKAAIKQILPLLEKRPSDAGLVLTIVHLYLLTSNHAAAITLIESFFKRLEQSATPTDLDVRFAPGLIATIVSLYTHQNRKSPARQELAKAARHWRTKSKANPPPSSLLKAAATSLLDSHDPIDLAQAGSIFADLHARDSTDPISAAGLIAAFATTDPSKLTADQISSLPPTARLLQSIDAAALETAGVAVPISSLAPTPTSKKRPADDKPAPSKPAKLRKSRIPKDFEPNKKVDPERWLPLRDRSSYKPKGKKGKKKDAGLTQGGPVVEERASTPVVESKAAGGGVGKQGAKKKKGKGGKW